MNVVIRKFLLVLQFVISIGLIVCTLIINQQMSYVLHKDLGFDKEDILILTGIPKSISDGCEAMKKQLLNNPHIKSVTTGVPLGKTRLTQIGYYDKERNKRYELNFINGDYDYLTTTGLKLVAGRDFSRDFPTDEKEGMILNETAIREFEITDPIGKNIKQFNGWNQKIIGVVKDFHLRSLHTPIPPVCIRLNVEANNTFSSKGARMSWGGNYPIIIKIDPINTQQTIQSIKDIWKSFEPFQPMNYYFLDDELAKQYISEEKLATLFNIFSLLAIFISCLGLFGLVSLSAEQQTKEIGVRKVLGASVSSIVLMLTKGFALWILLANLVAWPIAYYAMNKWLQDFAYRIEITIWPFLLAGILALMIALLTVSYQAIKAATRNPVEALRYE